MKVLVLLSALVFGALQSVVVIDCPCAALCGHKNACEGGKEEAPQDDCCRESQGSSSHERPCFHLEPQSDVDGPESEKAAPVLCLEFTPALFAVPSPEPVASLLRSDRSPPARGRPLYLQHSSLLI